MNNSRRRKSLCIAAVALALTVSGCMLDQATQGQASNQVDTATISSAALTSSSSSMEAKPSTNDTGSIPGKDSLPKDTASFIPCLQMKGCSNTPFFYDTTPTPPSDGIAKPDSTNSVPGVGSGIPDSVRAQMAGTGNCFDNTFCTNTQHCEWKPIVMPGCGQDNMRCLKDSTLLWGIGHCVEGPDTTSSACQADSTPVSGINGIQYPSLCAAKAAGTLVLVPAKPSGY